MSETVARDVQRVANDDPDGRGESHNHEEDGGSCPLVLDPLVPHEVPGDFVAQPAWDGQGQVAEGDESCEGRDDTDCVARKQPHCREFLGQLVEDPLGLGVLDGVSHLALSFPIYRVVVNVSILNSQDEITRQ